MKYVLAVLLLVVVGYGASAQHKRGGRLIVHPRVGIGSHFGNGNNLGYGYGYNPFYPNRYNNNYYYSRPSKLDLQIRDIENEYRDKKASVKLDKTLTRKQRREIFRALGREKERVVLEARRNYYKGS